MSWQTDGYSPFHEVNCDLCNTRIRGTLYKCTKCSSLSMCEVCYFSQQRTLYHDPKKHPIQLIFSDLDKKAQLVHTRFCDGCKSDYYPGKRYKCQTCKDLDLCKNCWDNDFFGSREEHCRTHKVDVYDPVERTERENYFARAITLQNQFGYALANLDWSHRNIRKNGPWADQINLGKKIGYAYYGEPTREPKPDSFHYGYTDEQDEHITKVIEILLELEEKKYSGEDAQVKFVFASWFHTGNKQQGTLPLIRLNKSGSPWIVEPNGRTYDGWDDFLNKNLLPEAWLIYPEKGYYEVRSDGFLNLVKGETADCDESRKIAKAADISTGIVCTTVGVAAGIAMFTPFAPIAGLVLISNGIVGGTYGAARGGYKLADKALHNQSILPTNLDNFFDWLTIVSSVASFGSMGAASYAARGVVMSQTARIVVNVAIFGNLTVSGVGIGLATGIMIGKWLNGEKPSALELVQCITGLIFFTSALVTVQTAGEIATKVAQDRVNHERSLLNTDQERAAFDARLTDKMRQAAQRAGKGSGRLQGLVDMSNDIAAMKRANTYEGFFANRDTSKAGSRHCLSPNGYVKDSNGVYRGINTNSDQMKALHKNAAAGRGQSRSPTTAIMMTSDELNVQIKGVLDTGK